MHERCHSTESFCQWEQVGCWEFPKMQGQVRKVHHAAYEKINTAIEELTHDWMNNSITKCTAGTVVGESSNHPTFSKTLAAKPVSTAHIPELDPKLRKSTSKGNILR